MSINAFFNGVNPSLYYSHALFNGVFGTNFSPTQGMPSSLTTRSAVNQDNQNQLEALNGLYARQYDLLTGAEELSAANSDSVFYQKTATSSDESVAEVTSFNGNNFEGKVPDGTFEIDVTSLAAEQINLGAILDPTTSPSGINTGTNTFTLTVGGVNYNLSLEVHDFENNLTVLTRAAEAINGAESGVTASVLSGSGGIRMKLVGETGAGNDFSLSDVSGNLVSTTGADTVDQSASDAVFTIDGTPYSQGNNKVFLFDGRLEATLTGAGSTTLTIESDTTGMSQAIESVVSSINDFTGYLASNAYLNPNLTSRWESWLQKTAAGLKSHGISISSNGQLQLNADTLSEALAGDTDKVREAFGGPSGLSAELKAFSDYVLSSPGARLLKKPPSSGQTLLYLNSITSSPRFRQGSALFWQVV